VRSRAARMRDFEGADSAIARWSEKKGREEERRAVRVQRGARTDVKDESRRVESALARVVPDKNFPRFST
jgi:hypothetical protein